MKRKMVISAIFTALLTGVYFNQTNGHKNQNNSISYFKTEAKPDLTKSYDLDSNNPIIETLLRRSLLPPSIRNQINKYLNENMNDNNKYLELASILYSNDYQQLGIEIILKIIENDGSDMNAVVKLIGLYEKTNQFEEINNFIDQLIEKHPDNIDLYNNLSSYFFDNENYTPEFAIDLIQTGIEKNPNNHDLRSLLGDYYKTGENYDEALRHYSAALSMDPSDPSKYFKIGELYVEMGQNEIAQKWFLKAINISEEFNEIVEKIFHSIMSE